jgi:hypothetical protein
MKNDSRITVPLVVLSGTVPVREAEQADFCKCYWKLQMHAAFVNLNRDGAPTNHSMLACVSRVALPRTELVYSSSFPRDGVTKRNLSEQSTHPFMGLPTPVFRLAPVFAPCLLGRRAFQICIPTEKVSAPLSALHCTAPFSFVLARRYHQYIMTQLTHQ